MPEPIKQPGDLGSSLVNQDNNFAHSSQVSTQVAAVPSGFCLSPAGISKPRAPSGSLSTHSSCLFPVVSSSCILGRYPLIKMSRSHGRVSYLPERKRKPDSPHGRAPESQLPPRPVSPTPSVAFAHTVFLQNAVLPPEPVHQDAGRCPHHPQPTCLSPVGRPWSSLSPLNKSCSNEQVICRVE